MFRFDIEKKYRPYPKIDLVDRQWPNREMQRAPLWCSVDLRDGNQALPNPMNIDQKTELFDLLLEIGFREIEVGFPSSSDTEFAFCRKLIEKRMIPDGVAIQVLCQAREHLIRRNFEALKGASKVIFHLYNSTSPLQRRVTFGMTKEQILQIAIDGTRMIKKLRPSLPDTEFILQYSPESFSDTETDYALEVCEAVMDAWEPGPNEKVILNLPATVEVSTPNVYADQIEWFIRNLKHRDHACISLHTHNDRGTGVAATELGLLAGADRVEGTLFGNGERTGNLDIITVALNMMAHGIDPELDFSNLPRIREICERNTEMPVPPRHPYGGDLVFTSFSGSHQDAIKKGMDLRQSSSDLQGHWAVPYLMIDPNDIGRTYKAIIRINSQSGKGGVAYILQHEFGYDLPKTMHPEVGKWINDCADSRQRELSVNEIHEAFLSSFVNLANPLELIDYDIHRDPADSKRFNINGNLRYADQAIRFSGSGNGPINGFVHALESLGYKNFRLTDYRQHAIGEGSATQSAAYIEIETSTGKRFWGSGLDANIEFASLKALVSAYNRSVSSGRNA
jgi:2-isopropylmalate synthase